jgi:hypothetical protein
MVIVLHAVDAPGRTCDPGEESPPTWVNLRMVDDDGDVLIDSAKNGITCVGGAPDVNLKRSVLFQAKNCEDSRIPDPGEITSGDITATASVAGLPDYVETLTAKCSNQ